MSPILYGNLKKLYTSGPLEAKEEKFWKVAKMINDNCGDLSGIWIDEHKHLSIFIIMEEMWVSSNELVVL